MALETAPSPSLKPHVDGGSKCPPHGHGGGNRRWDMLTRFHAGYFRISLALSGQALLWRTLISSDSSSTTAATEPPLPLPLPLLLRSLPSVAFLLLWSLALLALLALAALYAARCLLRFPAVRAEFRHHVAMNYLFAPWISCLLLLQSAPFLFLRPSAPPYHMLWWAFSLPILALDVKIYGQWFTRGRKFLSMVANPASHITVIGNLVTARAAARMGWHEAAVAIFAVGAAHYLVLFVTLYQRFLGSDSLPAMLRPVFFLFFAAPSMASLAWDAISASFDTCCKMLFFLSLFLFASLVSRPTLFKRSMRRFSVAWWAYSFPLTLLALASAEYAREVRQAAANALMLALAVLSVAVTLALMLFTALRTADLLPRDDPFDCPPQRPPRTSYA
ncbi:S-type anion channel SLAH1 [Zea mays]|uniref:S-type anion channel SLAH1 n=1 Tax=Zea mays TaxID=4577 RepID=A0A1D6MEP6_MAIZE|nr:S-type anion channel SLAH1 [Zea mays]ONM28110.1 S-type anion channel SLAH1 [Zea mays]